VGISRLFTQGLALYISPGPVPSFFRAPSTKLRSKHKSSFLLREEEEERQRGHMGRVALLLLVGVAARVAAAVVSDGESFFALPAAANFTVYCNY
jgi:hypothetical protein